MLRHLGSLGLGSPQPSNRRAAARSCQRINGGVNPDSIGVTVRYTHDYVTPLTSFVNDFAGGGLTLVLSETTVMALNPTI